jgi:glycosyltransferase involved in cell wall biosynthesis
MIKKSGYRLAWSLRMRGYQRIFANSGFSAAWIERRWGRAAEVLYPPVDLDPPLVEKKNLIVSVGRITGEHRSKNQLEQVRAFREFARGFGDSWTLRIIGSCGQERQDRDYLTAIQEEANGLPIELCVNVDRKVTLCSLAEAKLFWHTAGLSSDENEHPEHAEHFGIATVEAMRAGCVPVVIASGGQREIVEAEISGFLAKNLPELIRSSVAVARDDQLMKRVRDRAQRRSMAFSGDYFDQRFLKVVTQLVSD